MPCTASGRFSKNESLSPAACSASIVNRLAAHRSDHGGWARSCARMGVVNQDNGRSRAERGVPSQTAYEILEVPEHATDEEIRSARRRLAFDLHPDRLGQVAERVRTICEERLKQVEAAYAQLQGSRRALYDEMLRRDRASQGPRPPPPPPPPPPTPTPVNARKPKTSASPRLEMSRSYRWFFVGTTIVVLLFLLSRIPSSKGRPSAATAPLAQQTSESQKTDAKEAGGTATTRWWVRASDTPPDEIDRAAKIFNIPAELIRAVIAVESEGDAAAVSPKGKIGLMGLTPKIAAETYVEEPLDPAQNIMGGTRYLRQLANEFGGDMMLVLAAYNAGPDAVRNYKGIPPYEETRLYVKKVLAYYYQLRRASRVKRAQSDDAPLSPK